MKQEERVERNFHARELRALRRRRPPPQPRFNKGGWARIPPKTTFALRQSEQLRLGTVQVDRAVYELQSTQQGVDFTIPTSEDKLLSVKEAHAELRMLGALPSLAQVGATAAKYMEAKLDKRDPVLPPGDWDPIGVEDPLIPYRTGDYNKAIRSSALAPISSMLGGIIDGDPRFPDPFSMIPTCVMQTTTSGFNTVRWGTGGVANGWSAIWFQGNPYKGMLSSFDSSTSSTTEIDYANASAHSQIGEGTGYFRSRPLGADLEVRVELYGAQHEVHAIAVPAGRGNYSDFMGYHRNCPVHPADGLSQAAINAGGRQWGLANGDAIKLCSLPESPQSMHFATNNVDRGESAWHGWFVLVYGLLSTDLVHFSLNYREEAYPYLLTAGTQPHLTYNKSSSSMVDTIVNWVSSLSMKGATARIIRSIFDNGSIVGSWINNVFGTQLTGVMHLPSMCQDVVEQEEEKEMHVLIPRTPMPIPPPSAPRR